MEQGRIMKGVGGLYIVAVKDSRYVCKARGIFRKDKISPLPGDLVNISILDEEKREGVIDEILPRKNELIRPPVVNIDRMFIVISVVSPEPSLLLTDKLIAICESKGIDPAICINKTDLREPGELFQIYQKAGFNAILTCAVTGLGMQRVKELISGSICAFGGNSGVGKTSLLNRLGLEFQGEVGEVSHRTERGKHTTRHVELFPFGDGYIADTPGFGNLCLEYFDNIKKEELKYCFREFKEYEGRCRFTDCAHVGEPDCAVKGAVLRGDISPQRHESYVILYKEAKERPQYL